VSLQIAAGGPGRRFNINPQFNAPSPIRLSLVEPYCKTTAQIATWCIPKSNLQLVENGAASSRDIFDIGYIYTDFFSTFTAAESAISMPPKFCVLIRQTALQVLEDA
jgi:hypothetical protein